MPSYSRWWTIRVWWQATERGVRLGPFTLACWRSIAFADCAWQTVLMIGSRAIVDTAHARVRAEAKKRGWTEA